MSTEPDARIPAFDAAPIAENLQKERARVQAAANQAGRDPEAITLIAVSKFQPIEALVAAYEAGQRDFGENYVQELLKKQEALAHLPDLRFHFIGHLQSNKARQLIGKVTSVQSVDSSKLLHELNRRAEAQVATKGPLPIFIEVNLSGDETKAGCSRAELAPLVEESQKCAHLHLRGLMTIGALHGDQAHARALFSELKQLAQRTQAELGRTQALELSMGMSADLEAAIEGGSTMVRIGRAIFGERPPKDRA